jgi:hypothetical protein
VVTVELSEGRGFHMRKQFSLHRSGNLSTNISNLVSNLTLEACSEKPQYL